MSLKKNWNAVGFVFALVALALSAGSVFAQTSGSGGSALVANSNAASTAAVGDSFNNHVTMGVGGTLDMASGYKFRFAGLDTNNVQTSNGYPAKIDVLDANGNVIANLYEEVPGTIYTYGTIKFYVYRTTTDQGGIVEMSYYDSASPQPNSGSSFGYAQATSNSAASASSQPAPTATTSANAASSGYYGAGSGSSDVIVPSASTTGSGGSGGAMAPAVIPYQSSTLNLYPGWNMISAPVWAYDNLNTAGCQIMGDTWHYNAQTQQYEKTSKPSPKDGYWIYSANSCTISFENRRGSIGLPLVKSYTLYAGWNQVGYPFLGQSGTSTLDMVIGTCSGAITGGPWAYDAASQQYIKTGSLASGGAVWIYSTTQCQLQSPVVTPPQPPVNTTNNTPPSNGVVIDNSGKVARGSGIITIDEYGDFQCPYCGQAQSTLSQLLSNYNGNITLYFKNYPLTSIHPYAQKAAEAAQCADVQGRFWDYHDMLYSNQNYLDVASLKQYAANLGLDTSQFNSCLDSGSEAGIISSDMAEGNALGISGTPSFVIYTQDSSDSMKAKLDSLATSNTYGMQVVKVANAGYGVFFAGAVPYSTFDSIVGTELGSTQSTGNAKVSLYNPQNNAVFNKTQSGDTQDVMANYVATGNPGTTYTCYITVNNGQASAQGYTANIGTSVPDGQYDYYQYSYGAGGYAWYITCKNNNNGAVGTSETRYFTVNEVSSNAADLAVDSISINQQGTTDTQGNQNVAVDAVVKNVGQSTSDQYSVSFYMDGVPLTSYGYGTYVGLAPGATATHEAHFSLASGSHTVSFAVNPVSTDLNGGNNKMSKQFYVSGSTNLAPVVSIPLSGPSTSNTGQSVSWTITAYDPEGQPLSYSVDFGDGTAMAVAGSQSSGSQFAFSHTYTAAGYHVVVVTIADNQGASNKASTGITVNSGTTNRPPVINGVGGNTSLYTGQAGTWSISAYDPDGNSLYYAVLWGDEGASAPSSFKTLSRTVFTGSQASFQHTYYAAGTYTVQFNVSDDKGASTVSTYTVSVANTPTTQTCVDTTPTVTGAMQLNLSVGQNVTSGSYTFNLRRVSSSTSNLNVIASNGSVVSNLDMPPSGYEAYYQTPDGILYRASVSSMSFAGQWAVITISQANTNYATLYIGNTVACTANYKVRLSDISVATGANNDHPAILDVLDQNNNVQAQLQVSPGTVYTYTYGSGNFLRVSVRQTNPGFTLDTKWAQVYAYETKPY